MVDPQWVRSRISKILRRLLIAKNCLMLEIPNPKYIFLNRSSAQLDYRWAGCRYYRINPRPMVCCYDYIWALPSDYTLSPVSLTGAYPSGHPTICKDIYRFHIFTVHYGLNFLLIPNKVSWSWMAFGPIPRCAFPLNSGASQLLQVFCYIRRASMLLISPLTHQHFTFGRRTHYNRTLEVRWYLILAKFGIFYNFINIA